MQCVHGKMIYTGTNVEKDAYVVFKDTKLAGVSKRRTGKVLGQFPVITPAFIDPHSHIGMHRAGEPAGEGESNEQMDSVLALVDALDTVQMDDPSFADAVGMGVLYSCVVPGSGNLIGGLSAVIRNFAKDSTSALIGRAGLKAALGHNPRSTTGWKGTRPFTRMGGFAILRRKLDGVQQKMLKQKKAKGKKKEAVSFNAEERVLRDVLQGKLRLRVHCHKIDDIAALLRLVDAYGLKITVEHAADVHEPEILQELKARRIPVIYGPPDAFQYKVELKHFTWRNVKLLVECGCEVGLMSDHPVTLARMLFLQTRHFLRFGLSKQQAIELVSRRNAEVVGVGDKLGTLKKGKWASFVCWNGDPFDLASYPVLGVGEGKSVFAAT